jgi:hypothetical protein
VTVYRNRRTGEDHEPEPGSWMDDRLAALPEVWDVVEQSSPTASATPSRPAKTARKGDWVDYAMSRGHSREDAESLSRDDLVRLFDDEEA